MQYLVSVEEWENNKKAHRDLGNREALYALRSALAEASYGEIGEALKHIDRYIIEQNPRLDGNHTIHPIANPMLSIISIIKLFSQLVDYMKEKHPEQFKSICEKVN